MKLLVLLTSLLYGALCFAMGAAESPSTKSASPYEGAAERVVDSINEKLSSSSISCEGVEGIIHPFAGATEKTLDGFSEKLQDFLTHYPAQGSLRGSTIFWGVERSQEFQTIQAALPGHPDVFIEVVDDPTNRLRFGVVFERPDEKSAEVYDGRPVDLSLKIRGHFHAHVPFSIRLYGDAYSLNNGWIPVLEHDQNERRINSQGAQDFIAFNEELASPEGKRATIGFLPFDIEMHFSAQGELLGGSTKLIPRRDGVDVTAEFNGYNLGSEYIYDNSGKNVLLKCTLDSAPSSEFPSPSDPLSRAVR